MLYFKSIKNLFTLALLLCSMACFGQMSVKEQVAQQKNTLESIEATNLFKPAVLDYEANQLMRSNVNKYDILSVDKTKISDLSKRKDETLKINVPLNGEQITLNLVKADIFSDNFVIRKASNLAEEVQYNFGAYYWGEVDGIENSLVSVSIFKEEIVAVISIGADNYNLGKLENEDLHILYKDSDHKNIPDVPCLTDDVLHYKGDGMKGASMRMDESNCVGIYLETAYDMFVSEGSVANVTNFVTSVFVEVSALYANEAISLYINELVVWDVNDPYAGPGPGDYLDDFRAYIGNSFNGDLAHLLSYDVLGGVAYVDVLCNSTFGFGFSGIADTYNNVPSYSWTVEVITHELGHNLGSPHTHACAWNGNNTAIDGCGPAAGYSEGCSGPLPSSGTIMSYCHLVSGVGIDFNLGFGTQPGDLIRNEVYNATCLTTCVECPEFGDPCDDGDSCTTNDVINSLCNCEGTYTDDDNDGYCIGNDPDDNDPCVPDICPPCTNITITINLDNYPEETSWDIQDANSIVVASGGTYGSQPDGSTVVINVCLEDGCYDFTIYDSYGDGICCSYGTGSYTVIDENANTLASGGAFGSSETTNFCLMISTCETVGDPCDDGDICTTGETYDANCDCNGGVFQDSDGDGTCDAEDLCNGGPEPGTACNDGDDCTINDAIDANCNCTGTFQDSDGDGVCDADDVCPGFDDSLIGTACDDGSECTSGETWGNDCQCGGGTFDDADGDGVCDAEDVCNGGPDPGQACDDGDDCTINDTVDANCNCVGTFQDSDGDGTCDADDICNGGPEPGSTCNDGDDCTINDTVDASCNCVGTFQDTDGDGTCDADDICNGGPEPGSSCNDGDVCTINDTIDANCNCVGTYVDNDGDGFCAANDPDDNDPCVPDDSDPSCLDVCTEVQFNDFEQGWEGWLDGGSDANVASYPSFAYSGTQCLQLRDNSSTSIATSPAYAASGAAELQVDFTYITNSMDDSNEDFFLEVSYDGGAYSIVEEWNLNDEFVNNVREFASVTIPGVFTDDARIRFRCDASGNSDWVYIDDIQVQTCGTAADPTCNDGIMNGDEEGVDCGGTFCDPCQTSGCDEIDVENFDSGWGIWNDGGSDCRRSANDSFWANSGAYCIRLRDDNSTSTMSTDDIDLSAYDEVDVSFTYVAVSMDNSAEDFWLQVSTDGGFNYTTVEEWNLGDEFQNDIREFDLATIPGPFTSNTRLRFRCDGSTNGDRVYIDDVTIEGCYSAGFINPGTGSALIVEPNTLDLEIMPNPVRATEELIINISSDSEEVQLNLIDMYGARVMSKTVDQKAYTNYKLSTQDLSDGTYLIRIDSENGYKLKKLVVIR